MMDVSATLRMKPDDHMETIPILDTDSWNDKSGDRLGQIEMVEFHIFHKYTQIESKPLVKLFQRMQSVRIVHLSVINVDVNFDGLLDDLAFMLAKVTSLRLTAYRATTTKLLSSYFPEVILLFVENTAPNYLKGFHRIVSFVIYITDAPNSKEKLSDTDNEEYTTRISDNSETLRKLYIRTDAVKRFHYFVKNALKEWPKPRLLEIDVERSGPHPKLNYVITHDEQAIGRRTLEADGLSVVQLFYVIVPDLRVDSLKVFARENCTSKDLRDIFKLYRYSFKHVELKTCRRFIDVPVLMTDLFHALKKIENFSFIEMIETRVEDKDENKNEDSVHKSTQSDGTIKLVVNNPSGRYYSSILNNVQILEFNLGKTSENILSLFSRQLLRLSTLIELTLNDENFRLYAMVFDEINEIRKIVEDYNPWKQLRKLSVRIEPGVLPTLQPVMVGKMFPLLKTIQFTV